MRRALLVSLVLHLLGLGLLAVVARPRFTVPPRLQGIPVDFIALAAPAPALTERARPAPASPSASTERTRTAPAKPAAVTPDPLQPRPRQEPPRQRVPREEPKREQPKREEPKRKPEPKPDLPRRGSADTTQVMRSELPRVGDSRGAMQMRVEGEVLPYAYYLSIVQRKIASFWEPPSGIERQPGEVAAIIWFRIEKDGAVPSSYVEEPSGINPFDDSALRALARALPLPRLPEEYPGDHLIIHLRFVYSHDAGVPAETR